MAEYAMPRCDEPFDFRRQAATYACFRPDYAPALYEAIAARTGPGAGRLALDLGCGPGLVAGALARRGWQVVGVDFSAPMLAEARRTGVGAGRGAAAAGGRRRARHLRDGLPLVRARPDARRDGARARPGRLGRDLLAVLGAGRSVDDAAARGVRRPRHR